MNFFKKITQANIFQKVAQIANIQIKQKIIQKYQDRKESLITTHNNKPCQQQKFSQKQVQVQMTYDRAQSFILLLEQKAKQLKKNQREKVSKKQIFADLQIQPIYLQQCKFISLFKMEIQLGGSEGYQRTQILHTYLNQINQTVKNILYTQNQEILDTFQIVQQKLQKITSLLTKIKILRNNLHKLGVQKGISINKIMKNKLVIKQKLSLINKMKQKQQITLTKPENLQQIYYSQRNRHKLYLKIKNIKNIQKSNSYFNILKSQIIRISENNIKIIQKTFQKWINNGQQLKQKNIEKLLICLYFIKKESIYKQNSIDISLTNLNKKKFIQQIQKVKMWRNYQYIREPAMKIKIIDFLDTLIKQIQEKS